ncbi:MAG: M23 family metallopeptidase [Oscillospiraceae bacterium]|nr:M23 family metallopeptidase [Oscillospiraceae bacterium]
MKSVKFEKNAVVRFFKGKGFYVALAACLLAVCGVAVATFMSTMPSITPGNPTVSDTAPTGQHVDVVVSNVPDPRPTTTTTTGGAPANAAPVNYMLPLTNEVLNPYSNGVLAYCSTMADWRVHNGTDFKGTQNMDVKALADGTVTAVYDDKLWGGVVELNLGGGVTAKYCGVTSTLKEGDPVHINQVIGQLSDIPIETVDGPHLHLEMQSNGRFIDPVKMINVPVR